MAFYNKKPVWTDRMEHWPDIATAARAVGARSHSSITRAVATGRPYAGRRFYASPPQWAAAAMAETERRRVASVRCNPGRYGYVANGTDTRTGKVYAGGREVTEREGVTA